LKSVFTEQYALMLKILIDIRHECGLTQAELAKKLLKPQSFVSKYERGERRLDVAELIEIAIHLKHDPHSIITEISKLALNKNKENT
jgi:transcriptional regulator with XRE-family HTH domain